MPLKLITIAENCHILQSKEKEILFSYETPIGFLNKTTSQKGALANLSPTSKLHLHNWLGKTSFPETTKEAILEFLSGTPTQKEEINNTSTDVSLENDIKPCL